MPQHPIQSNETSQLPIDFDVWHHLGSTAGHIQGDCVKGAREEQGRPALPNPWLWPTDAAMEGSHMPTGTQRRIFYPSPDDMPMKIPTLLSLDPDDDLEEDAITRSVSNKMLQKTTAKYCPNEDETCHGHCRWHKSAETVGVISADGHVFTKTAGPRRSRISDRGARVELASICMVFDSSLRCGGVHQYTYQIMDGELGAADGAGFVFDSKVRRNNIQRMRSVFLNQRGRICLRNNQQVTKLQVQLPPLTVGVRLMLLIDLDSLMARFNVSNSQGIIGGSADVSLEGLFDLGSNSVQLRSGFFCAVVTGNITIGIH